MARRLVDTLFFQAEATTGYVYYDPQAPGGRGFVVEWRGTSNQFVPAPASQYQQFTGRRAGTPGQLLLPLFCETTDGITLTADSYYPFATLAVDPAATLCAAPVVACDLAVTSTVNQLTLMLVVSTSHGPWESSQDGAIFSPNRTSFSGQYGERGTITVRDAAGCVATTDYYLPDPANAQPPGDILDFFYYGGIGRPASRIDVYGLRLAPYSVAYWSPGGTPLPGTLTETERGHPDNFELPGRCGGATNTTRLRLFSTLAPPYCRVEATENAAACGYVPLGPPTGNFDFIYCTGTDETAVGGDGLIQAAVRGNDGPVLFSLDNFRTPGLASGTAVTFPSLRAGTYLVSCRETRPQGRTIRRQVTLVEPPHGLRYLVKWIDLRGVSCAAGLYLRGYLGGVETLVGAANVLELNWGASNASAHFFDQLRLGSEATLTALVQGATSTADLDLTDERQLRLDVSRNGQLVWTGWVLPDLYEEPLLPRPYPVTIRAADGLGALQQVPFADGTGNAFTGEWTHWAILRQILGTLSLPLPWVVLLPLYPVEVRPDATTETLQLVSCDVAGFAEKDGKPWTCEKVLQTLLDYYVLRVQQRDGCWYFERLADLAMTPLLPRRYDAAGQPLAAPAAYSLLRTVTLATAATPLWWRDERQLVSRHPAVAAVSVKAEPGEPRNYFVGGDFSADAFDTVTGRLLAWTGLAGSSRQPDLEDLTKPAALRLALDPWPPVDLSSPRVTLPVAGHAFYSPYTSDVTLRCTLRFTARMASGTFTPDSTRRGRAALYASVGFLTPGDPATAAIFPAPLPARPFQLAADKIPVYEVTGTGAAKITLDFALYSDRLTQEAFVRFYGGEYDDVLISDVQLTLGTATNGSYINESEGQTKAGPRLTKRDDALVLQVADTLNPDEKAFAVLARSVLLAETGAPLSRWREGPGLATPAAASQDLVVFHRLEWQQRPCWVLRGLLVGDCGPGALLVDPAFDPAGGLVVTSARWALADNSWEVTAVQNLALRPPRPVRRSGLLAERGASLLSEDNRYYLLPEHASN